MATAFADTGKFAEPDDRQGRRGDRLPYNLGKFSKEVPRRIGSAQMPPIVPRPIPGAKPVIRIFPQFVLVRRIRPLYYNMYDS